MDSRPHERCTAPGCPTARGFSRDAGSPLRGPDAGDPRPGSLPASRSVRPPDAGGRRAGPRGDRPAGVRLRAVADAVLVHQPPAAGPPLQARHPRRMHAPALCRATAPLAAAQPGARRWPADRRLLPDAEPRTAHRRGSAAGDGRAVPVRLPAPPVVAEAGRPVLARPRAVPGRAARRDRRHGPRGPHEHAVAHARDRRAAAAVGAVRGTARLARGHRPRLRLARARAAGHGQLDGVRRHPADLRRQGADPHPADGAAIAAVPRLLILQRQPPCGRPGAQRAVADRTAPADGCLVADLAAHRGRCRHLHAMEPRARLHRPRPPRHAGRLHALPGPGAALRADPVHRGGPLPRAGAGLDARLAPRACQPLPAGRQAAAQPLEPAADRAAHACQRCAMAAAAGAEHVGAVARSACLPDGLPHARGGRHRPVRPGDRPGSGTAHARAGGAQQRPLPLHQPVGRRAVPGAAPQPGDRRRRPDVGPSGRWRLCGVERHAGAVGPAARSGSRRQAQGLQARGRLCPPGHPGPLAAAAGAAGQFAFASNEARARDSAVDLIKRIGGCGQVAELRLPAVPGQRPPSMNWMLNAASREQIDAFLQEKHAATDPAAAPAQTQLGLHLRQAKAWLLQMK
ncbi:hypothetical protein OSTOST_09066 [Ostertagia ostertagi]